MFIGNTYSGIFDFETDAGTDLGIMGNGKHTEDNIAGFCEFDSIIEQIQENLT